LCPPLNQPQVTTQDTHQFSLPVRFPGFLFHGLGQCYIFPVDPLQDLGYLFCRNGRLFRQLPDFRRHHGKAPALLILTFIPLKYINCIIQNPLVLLLTLPFIPPVFRKAGGPLGNQNSHSRQLAEKNIPQRKKSPGTNPFSG
jgi:hypothetical protein